MVEHIMKFIKDLQIKDDSINTSNDNELSHHHKVPRVLGDLDWNDITDMIHNLDSHTEMSDNARQEAQQHKQTILSIQSNLAKEKRIMRASYKGYSFHTYAAKRFQQKASNYIKTTGIYNMINEVDRTNPEVSQQCLNNIIKDIEMTLNTLLGSKLITDPQYLLMYPQLRSTIRLNYLHFVPDTCKDHKPLQPIIICKNGPTWNLTLYLSNILWSMFNQITGCRKFSSGDDIVYTLEQYVKDGYLLRTTQFGTFNINEITLKFSHEMAIKALETFLGLYGSQLQTISEGLTNETILQLVRLVLRNQFFIYENKLYQQVYGSASGSLMTIPLVCIYLFFGQSSSLVQTLMNKKKEVFGRYRDDFILTWNNWTGKHQLLSNGFIINQQHPKIASLPISIGTTIRLLDLELGHNHNGCLLTKIYRAPKTDGFEIPNKFDYGTSEPSNLLKLALRHAVKCCSHEKYFQCERTHIELSHLVHGFSADFIDKCIAEFYNEFGIKTNRDHRNENIPYDTLRQRILDNYKQQLILMEEQKQQQRQQNIIRVPYPSDWDAQVPINMKNDVLNILKSCSTNKNAFDDMKFEFVPRPQTPLTINDYLVDKRPPLCLLTLPNDA
ncbi:unnamed protein product [Rotaria socialis]|uniref:Reverse transcriptase domain-containing protein n=1 Tax=Rotaria socialis TaxID=392032 RepID=A0A818SEJ6_9BILA|nr:unnamed protein product [Rotaria socialis]CAF3383938.1 unnamed protein product [Rotaria socialis]CAF3655734.1 unnamed protein product [Rotaria socialis]CAF3669902.1 unnamed protein product [Rotaria socialis]CAF4553745.1 unnamed protein product [Rotaria socialis]